MDGRQRGAFLRLWSKVVSTDVAELRFVQRYPYVNDSLGRRPDSNESTYALVFRSHAQYR